MDKIKIGYMGGVWDLFHVGHLNYIKKAKDYCDYLIVDVTPDELVYEQKGRYPAIHDEDRMKVVEAIRYVDRVGVSDADRDLGALKKYDYNILFISEDHRGKPYYNDLEEEMKKRGVEVIYIPYTTRVSSTQIKQDIRAGKNG